MKITINLTEEQFREIEEAADLVGLDKGVYLGKAVELMNQLAKRKGGRTIHSGKRWQNGIHHRDSRYNEMNYLISEELRDKLLRCSDYENVHESVGFFMDAHQELKELAPIQSGGVVTRVEVDRMLNKWFMTFINAQETDVIEKLVHPGRKGIVADLTDRIMSLQPPAPTLKEVPGEWDGLTKKEMWDLIQRIRKITGDDGTFGNPDCLVQSMADELLRLGYQPPYWDDAPTPQPEARGVVLSGVKLFLEQIVSVEPENEALWIGTVKANAYGYLRDLAHLQQAPRGGGDGVVESIKKTLEALRIRMSRLHNLDDGNIHLIALTIADNLPAPVKVADHE